MYAEVLDDLREVTSKRLQGFMRWRMISGGRVEKSEERDDDYRRGWRGN